MFVCELVHAGHVFVGEKLDIVAAVVSMTVRCWERFDDGHLVCGSELKAWQERYEGSGKLRLCLQGW